MLFASFRKEEASGGRGSTKGRDGARKSLKQGDKINMGQPDDLLAVLPPEAITTVAWSACAADAILSQMLGVQGARCHVAAHADPAHLLVLKVLHGCPPPTPMACPSCV